MELNPQFVIDRRGRRRSVLLSVGEYEELLECAQDGIDAALIDEVRGEPRVAWRDVKVKRSRGQRRGR